MSALAGISFSTLVRDGTPCIVIDGHGDPIPFAILTPEAAGEFIANLLWQASRINATEAVNRAMFKYVQQLARDL